MANTLPQDSESPDGVKAEQEALYLGMTEEEILRIVGKRVENGKAFYNKHLNLDKARKTNEKRWLNKNLEVSGGAKLHKFQVPYRDNRIFLSVETLSAQVASQIPEPVVTEDQDTDAARELADEYGKVLKEKARNLGLKGSFQMVARHILMGYRMGVIKVSWDDEAGRYIGGESGYTGDCEPKWKRPHKIVIDEETVDANESSMVAEEMDATIEELIHKFPDKKQEILDEFGLKSENRKALGKLITYWEIWVDFYDKDKIKKVMVVWKVKNLLLDAGLHPYYDYEEPDNNFLDHPRKPYVFFNFLQIGRWGYDDTSLTEQSATLQDVLEKRGRQIVENADQANSTKVFNTTMVDAKDIQKYTGDPRQSIAAKGDVRQAFKREAPPLLPSYVLKDKEDARMEIDNIFGTHAPLRGEATASPTLGQEVISQRSDLGRTKPLVDMIESGAVMVYEYMTQLYKLFADEEQMVNYTGDTGNTVFARFNKEKVKKWTIKVEAGSTMPDDKTVDRNEAIEMAKLGGRIDPLTFAQKMHLSNPREVAKRLIYFLWMPDKYIQEVLGSEGEGEDQNEATSNIQRTNEGENVPPPQNPGKQYLAAYNQFIRSPAFKQLDPQVQQLHTVHLRGAVENAKGALGEGQQGGIVNGIKKVFNGSNANQNQ